MSQSQDYSSVKVSVRDGKSCEKILTIEVPAENIQKEYEEFYRAVTPKAKIPGFRPGKAPRDVIAMHFRDEARNQVLKNLISESFHWVMNNKTFEPVGMPDIRDVDFQDKKLSYRAAIEVRPKIRLSKTTGLNAKKQSSEIKPEEVEENLKRFRESLAKFKVVEDRPAAMGDFVIADYVCLVDGKEVEKRTDDWFELREDEFIKGFSPQLVGLKSGDEKEISIAFPEKMSRPELSGKPAVFKVKVREIKKKELPELNDELAKEAGEFKTLEELRAQIRKNIASSKEHEAEVSFENSLLEELIKHNKFDLPQGLIQRRFEYLLKQAYDTYKKQGGTDEDFEKRREELSKDLLSEAQKQVHLAFLLEEIAVKENISTLEEDFKKKFQETSEHLRQPVEHIEKYYAENERAKESLAEQIRNQKVIEFLKKNAKIK